MDRRELAELALKTAKEAGASYADVRVARYWMENLSARDGQVTGIDAYVINAGNHQLLNREDAGFGVRVIADGAWGFASSGAMGDEEVVRVAKQAVEVAKAASRLSAEPVTLAPAPVVRDHWQTIFTQDPFKIPMERKVQLLLALNDALRSANKSVFRAASFLNAEKEDKYFASSEGSRIEQLILRVDCGFTAYAKKDGIFKTRRYHPPPANGGYDYIESLPLFKHVQHTADEAVAHCSAPRAESGKWDLILLPSHLCLTIHESIGHATELDRILGWEANYAGTSFVKLSDLGKLKYGTRKVNIVADKCRSIGRASYGYDDDGVKTREWPLIKDGTLVGLQTTRDSAGAIGDKESMACSYAPHWSDLAMLRMPNVSLEADPKGPKLGDLIADTKRAVLIDGYGSYSIDQQRLNFQFSGDCFWKIENGKIAGPVKDVTYHAITPEFWNSVDAVGSEWEFYGFASDGKGQPSTRSQQSHGCPPIRVRNVEVGAAHR